MSNDKDEWKKSLDKDGITVFTRSLKSSKFKEFKAQAQIQGSVEQFKEIILDVSSYHEWMPDCKSAEVLSIPAPNDITYHMKLKVPFPFEDRDIIQQLILHEKKNDLEIEIVSRPDKVKVEKKYVRMTDAQGKWIVKNITGNKISIIFQYYADPGGDIPAWLVNTFIVKNPHITITRIREKMAD